MKKAPRYSGIVRRLDDLGRLVIPKEIRRSMNISDGSHCEIFVKDELICIRPTQLQCVFCGTLTDMNYEYCGVQICSKCRKAVSLGATSKEPNRSA